MRSAIGALADLTSSGPRNAVPVPFAGQRAMPSLFGRSRGASSRTEQLDAMGSMGTIYAIVTKLASATASADWHLYRKARSGLDADRTEITKHAAIDVWNHPNAFMTRNEFVEVMQQHLDLSGESEWLVETAPGFEGAGPLGLWPIRPDRMEPVPSATDFLAGWVYSGPDGQQVPLTVAEVIQLRSPDPTDPYRGLGPVQTVLADIEGSRFAADYNRNFFLNSGEPGGVLMAPETLTDPEFNDLRDRWAQTHRGISKAHQVAVLEGGVTYQPTAITQRDMQFSELRTLSSEMVRQAFGFPKPLLGSVDDVNRANAEAGEYVFSKWLIVPRLDRVKGALNNDFLPKFGPTADGLEWDYDSPVPADDVAESGVLTAKIGAVSALVASGFDPADVLAMLGLPALGYSPRPVPTVIEGN